MKFPKTLHVLTSEAWGGLELYVLQLIEKIQQAGGKVSLYCLKNSKVESEAQQRGISVIHGFKRARISVRDICKIRKLLAQEGFNLVHSHTAKDVWPASLALLGLKNKKHVFSLYMNVGRKKDLPHRFIHSKVNALATSSETLILRVEKNYSLPRERIHLLRYGRDAEPQPPVPQLRQECRKQWHAPVDDVVVGTMCRIDPAKGVREIAEALLLLPQEVRQKVKIWIMGSPSLHHTTPQGMPVYEPQAQETFDWLKDFAQKNEVEGRLQLIPFQKDTLPYLAAMDIFVLGTYKETYSLAVIDAMLMGLPLIGTNTGGTPEQLGQDRGILVEPQSAQSIADAIVRYVEQPELRARHGENGKVWAQREHSWENKLGKLAGLYAGVLAN